jgi:type VI secretion system protein ImpK
MSDPGPFDEKTQILPNPGGRRSAARRSEPAADADPNLGTRPAGEAQSGTPLALDEAPGINPLVDAAAPILALLSRLSTTFALPDIEGLRRRLHRELADFDRRAEAGGIPREIRGAAHYALCATVDDVAANTPWGGNNVWVDRGMARTFHNDASGGERFFHLLGHFERDPEHFGDVIELFYLCLSLGFQGRFGVLPNGAAEIAAIRDRLHRLIRRRRGEIAAELSPHWRGVSAPHRPLSSRIPLWVVPPCTALALLLVFLGFRLALASGSDALFADLAVLPQVQQPRLEAVTPAPPPPPPVPERRDIARLLAPEIGEGLVKVWETPQQVSVRLTGSGLFAPGSATLDNRFVPVVDRIAAALKAEPGSVTVVGHTDNQPIHTLRFPSNYELSLARAETIRARLAEVLGASERISAVGRADAEPIADNRTAQGRELNRRVEIIVLRSGQRR